MENQKEKPEDEKNRLLYRISRMENEKVQRDNDILAMEKRIAEIDGVPKKTRTVGITLWKEQAEATCKALNLVMAGDKAQLSARTITFTKESSEGRDKVHMSFEMPEADE